MFGRKKTEDESVQMVKLCNIATLIEAESFLVKLKSEDIPCYRMESGAGSYLTITAGMSLAGYDIYVSEGDVERATQIIV